MLTTIRCSNCGYESPLFGQFCSNCGQAVTTRCKVCGEANLRDATFCRNCGAELASAVVGLYLDRAMAWREQFMNMGWWDTPKEKGDTLGRQLVQQAYSHEPWIFLCSIGGGKYWKPREVSADIKNRRAVFRGGHMLATRCRLAIFDSKDEIATIVWYKDIAEAQWDFYGNAELKTQQGSVVEWKINMPGGNVVVVVPVMASYNPVSRTWSRKDSELLVKVGQQRRFMELIGDFVTEIVDVEE